MSMRSKVFTFTLLAALAFGPAPLAALAEETKDGHAHGKVAPGSHEDWCGEHQVPESMCTRCNPERGIHVFKNTTGTALYPHATPHDRKYSIGSQVLFDCLWPVDWDKTNDVPTLVSFKNVYTKDIQEKVLNNWADYGFRGTK